jgi:hypothetical protein
MKGERSRDRTCDSYRVKVVLVPTELFALKSGQQDLNLRPSAPKADALPKLRHAPTGSAEPPQEVHEKLISTSSPVIKPSSQT